MARRIFNYGLRIKWLHENPFSGLKPPKKKRVRKADPFTPDEVTTILKTAKAKYPLLYPFVLTAALTGERRNSIRMLNVNDVDTKTMIITFPAEFTKQREEIRRPIPLSAQALFVRLVAGRDPDEPLFLDHRGERWRDEDLDPCQNEKNGQVRLFGRLLRDAGVRVRGLHNFRSGVDTNLVDAGMTLDQATAVTGHTRKVAQEAYLRLQLDTKRKAMDTLAEAYGIEGLEGNGKKPKRPRDRKRAFKVKLSDKEIRELEELASKAKLEKPSDSDTRSGTSPRRNRE